MIGVINSIIFLIVGYLLLRAVMSKKKNIEPKKKKKKNKNKNKKNLLFQIRRARVRDKRHSQQRSSH